MTIVAAISLIVSGLFIYSTELTPEKRAAAREASTDMIATTMWACQLRFILTDAGAIDLVRVVHTRADETCVEYRLTANAGAQALVFPSVAAAKPPRAAPGCDAGEGRDITKAFASAFQRCPSRPAPAR